MLAQENKPIRSEFLPFHKPWLGEEEKREMLETLESGWITKGPKTIAFEEQFRNFVGSPYAIATNSCTAALHLALVALGIGEGDEVITTPITFAATVNVIEHCRAKPIFVDVDAQSLNLDPSQLEQAITKKTKVILPVHFAGQMCQMDKIMEVASQHKLKVIEDAAHATESNYAGKAPGQWGDLAAFSFYPTKNITTGEGGMVVTRDAELAEKIQILSTHGLSRDAWKRYGKEGFRHWEILEAGFKYHMADIQAALGIPQLKKIQFFWEKRKELTQFYDKAFQSVEGITPVKNIEEGKHAYHLYIIRVDSSIIGITRDEFLDRLQAEGIGVGVHYRAVHLHPFYQNKYQLPLGSFPIAEKASEEVLSIPLFPRMSLEDAEDVIAAIKKVIAR